MTEIFRHAAVATLLLLATGSAGAHTGGMTGFATITISGKLVRYNLTLSDVPPGPLADQMHLGQQGVTPDFRPLITAISEKIRLTGDGSSCTASEGRIVPPSATSVTGSGAHGSRFTPRCRLSEANSPERGVFAAAHTARASSRGRLRWRRRAVTRSGCSSWGDLSR